MNNEIPAVTLALVMLGLFLGSPSRREIGVYMASQLIHELTDPTQCPAPRRKQLVVTAAGSQLKCDEPATVLTAIVVRDRNGQLLLQPGKTCVYHSIETACWKLAQAIIEHDRQKPQRIVAAA